jgi:AcrR family transcriptional regulator
VTATRRRLTRDERREHLLDVAAALITASGFEAVTMEGVASQAGVSKGLGYVYFANRDELLGALFDREMRAMDDRVLEADEEVRVGNGTFEDRLRAIIRAGLDVVATRGVLIGALLRGKATDGPLEHKRHARQAVVAQYFTDMVVAEYGVNAGTARTAVGVLLGGYAAALDLWVQDRASREEIVEVFVRLATGGLAGLRSGTP